MGLEDIVAEAEENERKANDLRAGVDATRNEAIANMLVAGRAKWVTFLDDLADDLDISAGSYESGSARWLLKAKRWRIPMYFVAESTDWDGFAFAGSGDDSKASITFELLPKIYTDWGPYQKALGMFLLGQQRRYEAELERVIAEQEQSLSTPDDPGCADNFNRLLDAFHKLVDLAPERIVDWCTIVAASMTTLEEREEQLTAALERWREALRTWSRERAAVVAHNSRLLAALREETQDVTREVVEIEYVEIDNGNWSDVFGIRRVLALPDPIDDNTWMVLEDGQARAWTLLHIVRVSGRFVAHSTDIRYRAAFRSTWLGDTLYYTEAQEALVEQTRRALLKLPEEPIWEQVSGGLDWDPRATRILNEIEREDGLYE